MMRDCTVLYCHFSGVHIATQAACNLTLHITAGGSASTQGQRVGGHQRRVNQAYPPFCEALLCSRPADFKVIQATRYGFLKLVLRRGIAQRKRHYECVYRLLDRSLPAGAERCRVGWGWPVWQPDVHCR